MDFQQQPDDMGPSPPGVHMYNMGVTLSLGDVSLLAPREAPGIRLGHKKDLSSVGVQE